MPGKIFAQPAPAARPLTFSVEREALATATAFLAKSIVEKRNTIPILSNVVISALGGVVTLRGTDLDLEAAWTLTANVEADGSPFTVDAQMLADVVKAADKGARVTLSYDPATARCTVTSGRARHTLPTLPVADMPLAAAVELEPSALDVSTLAIDLARLSPFMSKEETRYYLNGVELAADGAGALAWTATNGALLARITRPAPAGLEALASVIVPRKAVAVVAKLAKAAKGTGEASVAIGDRRATFTVGGVTITTKLVDGTYPDTSKPLALLAGAQRLAFYDLEPDLESATVEAFRKALGVEPAVDAGEGVYGFTTPGAPEFTGLAAVGASKRSPFHYGADGRGADAVAFMSGLADRYGFDLEPFHTAALAFGEAETARHREAYPDSTYIASPPAVRLVERRGVILGATFGHVTREALKRGEYMGARPATDEEMAAAEAGEPVRGMVEDRVTEYAPTDIPAQYVDGAFCVVMPRERAEAVCSAVQFHAEDGMSYPVRSSGSAIELSEAAVRRLAGPVDPSTFRDIPAVHFYRGEALAAGMELPTPPAIDKARALRMTAAEMAEYAAACAPRRAAPPVERIEASEAGERYKRRPSAWVEIANEGEAWRVAFGFPALSTREAGMGWTMEYNGDKPSRADALRFAADRLRAQACLDDGKFGDAVCAFTRRLYALAEPVADVPADVAPVVSEPAPIAADPVPVEPAAPVEPVAVPASEPAPVPVPDAAPVEPAQAPTPVPVATVPADALEARLAALEAVVARLTRPVVAGKRQRSEAERRAILRAWRMRGEARAARAQAAAASAEAVRVARVADAAESRAATLANMLADARKLDSMHAGMTSDALKAAAAADMRAGRMVRAAVRHRTASRRLADDLRGAQAEARALARRLAGDAPAVRSRVPFAAPIIPTSDSGAVAAFAA